MGICHCHRGLSYKWVCIVIYNNFIYDSDYEYSTDCGSKAYIFIIIYYMDYNNYKFIILAIVGIAIGYILYRYLFPSAGSQLIGGQTHLSDSPSSVSISTLTTKNYTASSMSYSAWIYVNSIPNYKSASGSQQNCLFSLCDSSSKMFYGWYFDTSSKTLNVGYSSGSPADPASGSLSNLPKIKITEKFPIQDWSYVTVVLDNQNKVLNGYMNGKLVSSNIMSQTYVPPKDPRTTNAIVFGSGQDIYMANLTATNAVMNPDDVFSEYMKFASFTNSMGRAPFHFGFTITQNSNTQNYQLF